MNGLCWQRSFLFLAIVAVCSGGCGTMKSQVATEQLLISDAIERAVGQFDFTSLAGHSVFLDTTYMAKVQTQGFLNSDYIRSALRERLMASNCVLPETAEEADFIVEVRVGALGTDSHQVSYGIPASQALSTTSSLLAGGPMIPALPEVSLAKKEGRRGAAKIHLFAYRRETMEPVLTPPTSHGESSARSMWVLGAGPFEQGTIYDKTQFAGSPLDVHEIEADAIEKIEKWTFLASLREKWRRRGGNEARFSVLVPTDIDRVPMGDAESEPPNGVEMTARRPEAESTGTEPPASQKY